MIDRTDQTVEHTLVELSARWLALAAQQQSHDTSPESIAAADRLLLPGASAPGWIASAAVMVALDSARAAALLWAQGEVHFAADMVLLRSALENSALAWWVLSGSSPDERIYRSVQVYLDDVNASIKRETYASNHALSSGAKVDRAAVMRRIIGRRDEEIAKYRESGVPDRLGKPVDKFNQLSMYKILLKAQNELPNMADLQFTHVWQVCSSVAHGSATDIYELGFRARDEITGNMQPPVRAITSTAAAIDDLLAEALNMWNDYTKRQP